MPEPLVLPLDGPVDTPDALPPAFSEGLVGIRRHLHRNPEVGFLEHETSAYIRAVLEANGLAVQGPVAGTGLFVDIDGAAPGPRVGYRADIDALPIPDEKDVPYASCRAGVAHLCGHDAHTAVGLGVARLLHAARDRFAGSARVFFQPNEEGTPSGAPQMIAAGILDGLDAVYAIHVDPSLPTGRFGLIAGPATAAADLFRIVVQAGRTGHSARPHETRDPVWIATQITQALYQLVGRLTDARNPAVVTVCRFHAGEAYNVIPADAEFGGTLRTTDPADRAFLLDRMDRIARETAALYDVGVTVEVNRGAPPVVNDVRLAAHAEATIRALFGEAAVFRIPRPSMGGEDFAYYGEHLPAALVRVGTADGPETRYPLHHARFDLDERALAPTALLMSRVLLGHLRAGGPLSP